MDELEHQLKKLWSTNLDRDEDDIQSDADYFQIGGDSVSAIKLAGLASKNGLQLPAQKIFENSTLKEMAAAATISKNDPSSGVRTESQGQPQNLMSAWQVIEACLAQCDISNENLEDVLSAPPFQRELMQASHGLGAWHFQAVFQVGPHSLERAKKTFEIVRERVPSFRTRIAQHEGEYYQVVTRDTIKWTSYEGDIETSKRKELARRMCYGDALCRYGIVHDEGKSFVVWTMNHTIYDRFSKSATLEDVQECFQDPSAFANKPTRAPFRKFASYVSTLDERTGIDYWLKQLRGLRSHELLFKDDRRREYLTSVPHSITRTMSYTAPQNNKISFDTITQVAWTLVMSNESQSDDIFYCAFRSCRHLPVEGIEDIIGPLWSMVPIRRRLQGNEKLQEVLQKVQDGTVRGIQHEPFGGQAMQEFFGHKRYLQCALLPQPPKSDFSAAATAKNESGVEHSLKSIEGLWTQTRGHYGLYVMLTPIGDKLQIWARYDEHFMSAERVEHIVELYDEMLSKILASPGEWWSNISIQDLCPHLASKPKQQNNVQSQELPNGDGNPKTLTHLFRSQSKSDAALIVPGDEDMTFSHQQLHDIIGQLQQDLASLGIEKDSAVSIALSNCVELIAVFLAATWQRGIAAPLNPGYKQDEFEFYIDDLGSALVVIPKNAYDKAGPAVEAARKYKAAIAECYWNGEKIVLDVKEGGKLQDQKARDVLQAQEEDIALVLHTSGTTGRPKAVPLTHKNLMSNIANICRTYNLSPDDRTMLIMPLFHVHGLLASFLSPLYSAGSAIVPPKLEPSFWETFNKHGANWYSATPSMHRLILQFPPPDPLPEIRFIRSCSSQLAPSLFHQLKETFQAPVVESYAMTEASHLMASNPLAGEQKPGSVGKPQGITMVLLDADGNEVSKGQEGEVSIRGPNVTHGYLNNPSANKKEFTPEGFFRTGDQGKFDEDGYLHLTGRLKEMINKGGEKISPVELDNTIGQHDAIAEVVTFAMESEEYGQDVGAAVKVKDGEELEERELKRWVGEKVSAFKVPARVWFCEDIPKTATGKVQRRMVAEAMVKREK